MSLGLCRANPRSKVLYSGRLLLARMSGWLCWKMKSVMCSFTCTREQIKTSCTTAGNSLRANSPLVQSLFSMQICFNNLSIPLVYHQSLEKAVDMWIVSVYAFITLCVVKKLDVTAVGLRGMVFPQGCAVDTFVWDTYCSAVYIFNKIGRA